MREFGGDDEAEEEGALDMVVCIVGGMRLGVCKSFGDERCVRYDYAS